MSICAGGGATSAQWKRRISSRDWQGGFGVDFAATSGSNGSEVRRQDRARSEPEQNRRTRVGNLMKQGISKETAVKTGCARKGAWRMSQVKWVMIALPNDYFTSRGLVIPWT